MNRTLVTWIAAVGMVCGAAFGSVPPSLDPLWNDAVGALKQSDHRRASELFDRWITDARASGIQSSEAHYNLALAEWALNNPGRSIQNFLQGAMLVSSPLETLRNFALLDTLERQIGIKESAARSAGFRTMLLLNENFTTLLSAIGFWMFCALSVVRWIRNEKSLSVGWTKAMLFVPLGLWLVAGIGAAQRHWGGSYGVLGDGQEVAIFQKAGPSEKLIELPAGTVVKFGPAKNGFVQIVEPVSGWIEERAARPVALPAKGAAEVALLRK